MSCYEIAKILPDLVAVYPHIQFNPHMHGSKISLVCGTLHLESGGLNLIPQILPEKLIDLFGVGNEEV